MEKRSKVFELGKYYTLSQILLSHLTGFLFFLFPTILLTSFMVLSVLLFIYNLLYFLVGLFILLILLTFFTNHVIITTLRHYRDIPEIIDYPKLIIKYNIFSSVVLLFIFAGVTSYLYIYVL